MFKATGLCDLLMRDRVALLLLFLGKDWLFWKSICPFLQLTFLWYLNYLFKNYGCMKFYLDHLESIGAPSSWHMRTTWSPGPSSRSTSRKITWLRTSLSPSTLENRFNPKAALCFQIFMNSKLTLYNQVVVIFQETPYI